jgi:hypothetical protein
VAKGGAGGGGYGCYGGVVVAVVAAAVAGVVVGGATGGSSGRGNCFQDIEITGCYGDFHSVATEFFFVTIFDSILVRIELGKCCHDEIYNLLLASRLLWVFFTELLLNFAKSLPW